MRLLILFTLLVCTLKLTAQDNRGYYDSKFFLSFDGLVNNPFFYNMKNDYFEYSKYNKKLEQKSDKINFGFKLDLGIIAKRNLAFSVELGQEFSNIYTPSVINYIQNNGYYSNTYNINVIQSQLYVRTFSIFPKIHFATKNALLPLGLSHQIGLGMNYSTLVDKNDGYIMETNNSDYYYYSFDVDSLTNHYDTKFFDFENQKATKTIAVLYALNMKTPITKKILLNYGFRYTLRINYFSNVTIPEFTDNKYIYSQGLITDMIKIQRTRNIINFNLGLTYVF